MSVDSEVGKLDIVLSADASKASAEVDKFNAKLDAMMDRARTSGQGIVSTNNSTVQSLEGVGTSVQKLGVTVDNLGSRFDAFTGRSHSAWNGLASIVGGATGAMITKVIGFIDRVNKIPDAVNDSATAMQQKDWLGTDQLRVANDLLEQQHALFEKKPVNNAKLALDEERVAADQLATSAAEANKRVEQVLSANHIAAWKVLLGAKGTANVEGSVNSWNQQIQDAALEAQIAKHNGDEAAFRVADRKRMSLTEKARKWDEKNLPEEGDTKNAGNRSMILLQQANLDDQQDQADEADRAVKLKEQNRKDAEIQRQRAAAAAALAASKAADAAQLQVYESAFSGHKALQVPAYDATRGDVAEQDAQTWLTLATSRGLRPGNQEAVNRKVDSGLGGVNKDTLEELQKYQKLLVDLGRDQDTQGLTEQIEEFNRSGETVKRFIASLTQAASAQVAFRRSSQDVALQIRAERGEISQADYVRQQALLHEQRYAEDRAKLEGTLQSAIDRKDTVGAQAARTDLISLDGNRVLEQMRDQATLAGLTFAGGLRVGLNRFVQDAADAGRQAAEVIVNGISSVNQTLAETFTHIGERGHRHLGRELSNGLGQDARQMGGQLANLGLKSAEGAVLGSFGLGKPDGTTSNPWNVKIVGSNTTPVGFNNLFGSGAAGDNDGGDDGGGKTASGIVSWLGGLFGGGRAMGGPTSAGMTYLIGEHEPELLTMGSSPGFVTPLSKVGGGSGGGSGMVVHVDARGTSDPAQTRVQARRGAMEGHAASARAYGDSQQDAKRRRPLSAR